MSKIKIYPDAYFPSHCKLGEQIVTKSESLRLFSKRYPKVRQRAEIRRFICRKHFKVFYRIREDIATVEILRCWDARRDGNPDLPEKTS